MSNRCKYNIDMGLIITDKKWETIPFPHHYLGMTHTRSSVGFQMNLIQRVFVRHPGLDGLGLC